MSKRALSLTVPITVEGLKPGEYRVRTDNSEFRTRAAEKLEVDVPVDDAKSLHISRVAEK